MFLNVFKIYYACDFIRVLKVRKRNGKIQEEKN